jgi:hypothetical protein
MGYLAARAAAGVGLFDGSVLRAGRAGVLVCPNPEAGASISKISSHFIVFSMVDAASGRWVSRIE